MTTLPFDLETPGDTSTAPTDPNGTWVYNGNLSAEGVDYLIDLFRKPRSIAELEAFLAQAQEIEDATWELKTAFDIATAVGTQLDMVGALFGEPRFTRTDADYRSGIRARWLAQRANGRPEELITIVKALSPTDTEIVLQDAPPQENTIYILRSGQTDASAETIYRLLQLAHAGGTKLNIGLHDEPSRALRVFAETDVLTSTTQGVGYETDDLVGGKVGYEASA